MKLLYFGTSPFAIPALRAVVAHGYPVVGVVTQPDRPAGRGGKVTPSAVKVEAERLGLRVLQPERCRAAAFLEEARALAPDLNVVAAYGQFLPDALRTLPPHGSVNLHGSLLPKLRGAAPIQRAIWEGETVTGVCLMWMAQAMDAGDVIDCAETPIRDEDNAGTLGARLAELSVPLLLRWLPEIARGTAPHIPQDPERVTFAPPIRKEERPLDWSQPALQLFRQVRALAPAPGATAVFREMLCKMLAVAPITQGAAGIPGTIVESHEKTGPIVQTGDGQLRIVTLQPAGKRPMSGAEFVRGYRVERGERFATASETRRSW